MKIEIIAFGNIKDQVLTLFEFIIVEASHRTPSNWWIIFQVLVGKCNKATLTWAVENGTWKTTVSCNQVTSHKLILKQYPHIGRVKTCAKLSIFKEFFIMCGCNNNLILDYDVFMVSCVN